MGKQYNEVCETILKGLEGYKDDYFNGQLYFSFEDEKRNLKEAIEEAKKEHQLLKIGIVGGVKAGKSSFLNALIFDGEDILPKAITPMTATLTRITYSEKPSATIYFYTQEDWDSIERRASSYDKKFDEFYSKYVAELNEKKGKGLKKFANLIDGKSCECESREAIEPKFKKYVSTELTACKELMLMHQKNLVDLSDILGTKKEIDPTDMSALQEYIGAGGKYSPVVKYVELRMNKEDLKDVEIIDTPGLNDPIASRSNKTTGFLEKCNVVLYLSYVSQFLERGDVRLLCSTLPKKGIKNIVIVGSKFDSALTDTHETKDINKAIRDVKETCNKRAEESIDQYLSEDTENGALRKLKASLPPSYISSLLYSCAKKKKNAVAYSEYEANIINLLKNDHVNFTDDYKNLLVLSGINRIKSEKIKPIYDQRLEILREKNDTLLFTGKRNLLELLDGISTEVYKNMSDIEKNGREVLEKNYEQLKSKIDALRPTIRGIFEDLAVEATWRLKQLATEIKEEASQHRIVKVDEHTDIKTKSFDSGFLGLWTTVKTYEVTTYSLEVREVLRNLSDYITECDRITLEVCKHIIDKKELQNKIINAVKQAYDLSDPNFDKQTILAPVTCTIGRIQIPDIDIDVEKYHDRIEKVFTNMVATGNEIHKLKAAQERELTNIATDMKDAIDKYGSKLSDVISIEASVFVDNIVAQLNTNLSRLKSQLDDKEKHIRNYKRLHDELLPEYRKLVAEMELEL